MDNKIPENDIKIENGFTKKFENFWYYHKWKVIIGAFVAFVLAVCIYSCAAKPKIDITLLYAGPYSSYDSATPKINESLTAIMPESVGTNGAALNVLEIYSTEKARELAEKTVDEYIAEEKQNGVFYSPEEREHLISQQVDRYNSINMDNSTKLGSYLGMGNYSVCLLDPSVYETYRGKEIFVLLSDVFGNHIPASAYSEDAVSLSETWLYVSE